MSDTTPKPNPEMFRPLKKGFEKLTEEAQKGGDALKALNDSIPTNKQQGVRRPFVRREHLTQRPFVSPEMANLRQQITPRKK